MFTTKMKKTVPTKWAFGIVLAFVLVTCKNYVYAAESSEEVIVKIVDSFNITFIAIIIGIIIVVALVLGVKHFKLKIKDLSIDSGDNNPSYNKNMIIVVLMLSAVFTLFLAIISCECILISMVINQIA